MRLFRRLSRPPAPPPKAAATLARPDYADRHRGRTLVVLGNGPSLHDHRDRLQRLIAERDPVVLGANHIRPFTTPDYHAFTNRKRFIEYAASVDPERSRLLVGAYLPEQLVRLHHPGPFEWIPYVNDNEARFDVVDGVVQAGCRTVSVLLIAVAAVMGADEILVAGLDGFPPDAVRLYHAETEILKASQRPSLHEEVHAYTTRFLREIQEYLAAHGRRPFAIVTPTVYAEHHRPEILAG